jgi:hypothetical protein
MSYVNVCTCSWYRYSTKKKVRHAAYASSGGGSATTDAALKPPVAATAVYTADSTFSCSCTAPARYSHILTSTPPGPAGLNSLRPQ